MSRVPKFDAVLREHGFELDIEALDATHGRGLYVNSITGLAIWARVALDPEGDPAVLERWILERTCELRLN